MAGDYYSRVTGRFWVDTKGWGERNQIVALYLLTNSHRSMEGLYHLPLGYLCSDLGLTPRQAKEALAFIEQRQLVTYDADAEVVLIRKALKHGAPKTANHVKGAIRRLNAVPWSPLWHEFFMACECHASELAAAIRVAWPDSFASSDSSSSSTTPPAPPLRGGENDEATAVEDAAPTKPSGGRRRDTAEYMAAMAAWASRHFPTALDGAPAAAVGWLKTRTTGPVTAADVRHLAASNDMWAEQLGLTTNEGAAA